MRRSIPAGIPKQRKGRFLTQVQLFANIHLWCVSFRDYEVQAQNWAPLYELFSAPKLWSKYGVMRFVKNC